jgi:FkbM family methyltransferase
MATAILKRLIKAGLNQIGVDVSRRQKSPSLTLLGLRSMPIQTVIDVGANTGQFAKKASRVFPNATLYCFEPLPEPFRLLSTWAQAQRGRVVPYNLALGERDGDVEMFLHKDHTSSSSLLTTTALAEQYYPFTKEQTRISVRQATLDGVFEKLSDKLSLEILVKVDVQGYEDRVIMGGSRLLTKASACILEVSLDTLYHGQSGFRELLTMLDDLGYRYGGNLDQTYAEDGHCVFLDAVFLKKTESTHRNS